VYIQNKQKGTRLLKHQQVYKQGMIKYVGVSAVFVITTLLVTKLVDAWVKKKAAENAAEFMEKLEEEQKAAENAAEFMEKLEEEQRKDGFVIASYNMSYATDLGKLEGSEKHFIKNAQLEDTDEGRHSVWENAVNLVCVFFNKKYPDMMGFQEMNDSTVAKSKSAVVGGFQHLIQKLETNTRFKFAKAQPSDDEREDYLKADYLYTTHSTAHRHGKPTNLLIWKKNAFGDLYYKKGYDLQWDRADIHYDTEKGTLENRDGKVVSAANLDPSQGGRPLQMVMTTKGYFLINLHAPNDPEDSKQNMEKLKKSLHTQIKQFMSEDVAISHPDNIIMVGDFNDPLYGFNSGEPLRIRGSVFRVHRPVYSCCYNYNSACTDNMFLRNDQVGDRTEQGVGECKHTEYEKTGDSSGARPITSRYDDRTGKMIENGYPNRGSIGTYRFTGDYCVVSNDRLVTKFTTYPPVKNRLFSKESDHEMVWAIVSRILKSQQGL
jgi:hypothetical protein